MNTRFSSFVMGGFECNAALDRNGRFDDLSDTRHNICTFKDYKLLQDIGINTVREGLQWSKIDKGDGIYDFDGFEQMMIDAKKLGIQQIWDLNHFDYPEHIDIFSKDFIEAFTDYALICVKVIRKYQPDDTIYIVPFNEISFFTHMGGGVGAWAPFKTSRGDKIKRQAVKAVISAINAIREEDTNVRFIHVDPIMVRIPDNPNDIIKRSNQYGFSEVVFEALDMLCGRKNPELGGSLSHLDMIGINHYPTGQEILYYNEKYQVVNAERLDWIDNRWTPFSKIIASVYARYNRPIIISETGAWGSLRVPWWKMVFDEVDKCLNMGIEIEGVCAYPVVDRRDWSKGHLTNSGLWDFEEGDEYCNRIPHKKTIEVIRNYMESINQQDYVEVERSINSKLKQ